MLFQSNQVIYHFYSCFVVSLELWNIAVLNISLIHLCIQGVSHISCFPLTKVMIACALMSSFTKGKIFLEWRIRDLGSLNTLLFNVPYHTRITVIDKFSSLASTMCGGNIILHLDQVLQGPCDN